MGEVQRQEQRQDEDGREAFPLVEDVPETGGNDLQPRRRPHVFQGAPKTCQAAKAQRGQALSDQERCPYGVCVEELEGVGRCCQHQPRGWLHAVGGQGRCHDCLVDAKATWGQRHRLKDHGDRGDGHNRRDGQLHPRGPGHHQEHHRLQHPAHRCGDKGSQQGPAAGLLHGGTILLKEGDRPGRNSSGQPLAPTATDQQKNH